MRLIQTLGGSRLGEPVLPFTASKDLLKSDRVALILAYGQLSLLEACSSGGNFLDKVESVSDRIAVAHFEHQNGSVLTRLAGVHKLAPVLATAGGNLSGAEPLVDALAFQAEDKQNVSVSGYGIDKDTYEDTVRAVLDGLKSAGLRKVRLLRPDNDELQGEQVVTREAMDVAAFPYHGGVGLGLTTWVPDSISMRKRGTDKPVPRPDISLSPRLARTLVNLSGLRQGQTLLDPFCGSGTILAEAYMQSIHCLGLDAMASRVQDARQNLDWIGGSQGGARFDIRKGDARDLYRMLRGTKVDAVVTEPLLMPKLLARPKTSTATQIVDSARQIYADSLESMSRVLSPAGRIVLVVPIIETMEGEEVSITLEGRKLGLKPFQPGPIGFEYPVRLSFESTRWVKRAVYVFEPA